MEPTEPKKPGRKKLASQDRTKTRSLQLRPFEHDLLSDYLVRIRKEVPLGATDAAAAYAKGRGK